MENSMECEIRKGTEEEGFEPSIQFPVCRFSKPVPSAARPPLQLFQRSSCRTPAILKQGYCIQILQSEKSFRHGGGGIRTHGTVSCTPVFKTGALNQLGHPTHTRLGNYVIAALAAFSSR